MSTFLINASNLKAGGGLQVADSICGQLCRFRQHRFIVVLSSYLVSTRNRIQGFDNCKVVTYDIPDSFLSIVLGRDVFLDDLVRIEDVKAVLTVFGPSRWRPRVAHLSGFALPQLVMPESPFFRRMKRPERLKWKVWCKIREWSLKRSADCFWTENSFITKRLKSLMGSKPVFTVSNFYNQVFDNPQNWRKSIVLPTFDGITCLSISSPTPHKNFSIIEGIVRFLRKAHPGFKVRFVLTFSPDDWPMANDVLDSIVYIGKVDVAECPNIYQQADIMFMPTLLECFTATYPEAMRMELPIVTTDLEFSRALCGGAACYYCALDAPAAAEAIYRVATDKVFAAELVANGKKRLEEYDNYEQRAEELLSILEGIRCAS